MTTTLETQARPVHTPGRRVAIERDMAAFTSRLHREAMAAFRNEPAPCPEWVNESSEVKRARAGKWIDDTTPGEQEEALEFACFLTWQSRARW